MGFDESGVVCVELPSASLPRDGMGTHKVL
jgi:hypothetical protein